VELEYVFVVKNLLTKEQNDAQSTHLRFYHDKELNASTELAQAPAHNENELVVLSKILGARYN
jgi:hypothetical protein